MRFVIEVVLSLFRLAHVCLSLFLPLSLPQTGFIIGLDKAIPSHIYKAIHPFCERLLAGRLEGKQVKGEMKKERGGSRFSEMEQYTRIKLKYNDY
jgi:hypothetical protein